MVRGAHAAEALPAVETVVRDWNGSFWVPIRALQSMGAEALPALKRLGDDEAFACLRKISERRGGSSQLVTDLGIPPLLWVGWNAYRLIFTLMVGVNKLPLQSVVFRLLVRNSV